MESFHSHGNGSDFIAHDLFLRNHRDHELILIGLGFDERLGQNDERKDCGAACAFMEATPIDLTHVQPLQLPTRFSSSNELAQFPASLGMKAVIWIGGDNKTDEAYTAIASLSIQYAIPVVATLDAKNIQAYLPDDHYLGVFGYAGVPRAYAALTEHELNTILMFGVPINERNTALWHPCFAHASRHVIHIHPNDRIDCKLPFPHLDLHSSASRAIAWLKDQ